MLRWILHNRIAAAERKMNADLTYVHEIINIDPGAFLRFAGTSALASYCRDLPRDAWFAAGLRAVLREDCGPCAQMAVDAAEKEGMDPALLRTVIRGEVDQMSNDVALAVRFADAVLDRSVESDELREEIRGRWGSRAVLSLAYTITAARMFPAVKYAMGHGKACSLLQVGGQRYPVHGHAATTRS